MSYKAFVFDFFGVICSEVAPYWLARYLPQTEATRVKTSIVHAADVGELSQQQLFSKLSEITGVPEEQIEGEWLDYVRIDEDVVDLIGTLRSQHILGLLTNSPAPFVCSILERYDLNSLFQAIVISSENHCAKPDPAIYKRMLTKLNVQASDTLMIDDNPANVAAAVSVGMGGVVFRSCSQLRSFIAT